MNYIFDKLILLQNTNNSKIIFIIVMCWVLALILSQIRIKKLRKNKGRYIEKLRKNKGLMKENKNKVTYYKEHVFIIGVIFSLFFVIINIFDPLPYDAGLEPVKIIREAQKNNESLVFIHGWIGSEKSWKDFTDLLQHDKRLDNYGIIVINYPTMVVKRGLTLSQIANSIFLDMNKHKEIKKISILSHSLGGVITRRILIQNKLNNNPLYIKNSVSIGSPFSGANLSELGSALGVSPSILPDLKYGSSFLKTLDLDWKTIIKFPGRAKQTCFSSPQDYAVDEISAAHLCDNFRSYPNWGHLELAHPDNRKDERYIWPIDVILGKT